MARRFRQHSLEGDDPFEARLAALERHFDRAHAPFSDLEERSITIERTGLGRRLAGECGGHRQPFELTPEGIAPPQMRHSCYLSARATRRRAGDFGDRARARARRLRGMPPRLA